MPVSLSPSCGPSTRTASDATRVILAKAVIAAALAIALGVLSVPVARLVAAAWYGFGGAGSWDASLGTAIHYGYGTVIAYAGFAMLGVVIGVLTRSVGIG